MSKSITMTHIFQNNFYNPFPSLYPHYQTCNRSFVAQKSYQYFTDSPLHENVIVYILSWRAMKTRMAMSVGSSIKQWMRKLRAFITLLFGICSSQCCFILDAFCGASLYRFPIISFSYLSIPYFNGSL